MRGRSKLLTIDGGLRISPLKFLVRDAEFDGQTLVGEHLLDHVDEDARVLRVAADVAADEPAKRLHGFGDLFDGGFFAVSGHGERFGHDNGPQAREDHGRGGVGRRDFLAIPGAHRPTVNVDFLGGAIGARARDFVVSVPGQVATPLGAILFEFAPVARHDAERRPVFL